MIAKSKLNSLNPKTKQLMVKKPVAGQVGYELRRGRWSTRENWSLGSLTRSDTNRAVQPQKMVRGLKFSI